MALRSIAHFSLIFFAALLWMVAGCQQQSSAPQDTHKENALTDEKTAVITEHGPARTAEPKEADKKDAIHISSTSGTETGEPKTAKKQVDKKAADPAPAASGNKESKKVNYDVNEPFDPEKPKLMGLSIHDTKDHVLKKFGKPQKEYVMEDDISPISVYEYPVFSVGFDTSGKVQFVDVSSGDVNPGLNGLRLGQKKADAIKALGEPDANTDYVMNYEANGIILKLDIDPKTQVINSIKLFGDS